ncbi:MAG: pentapeptide repeat-containing protein [Deltaproteobacteria bacterium]|nr:pentapeptide repeat-containing protein [Deltaproteobacteria bacterium]
MVSSLAAEENNAVVTFDIVPLTDAGTVPDSLESAVLMLDRMCPNSSGCYTNWVVNGYCIAPHAYLAGADLEDARLYEADLTYANLTGANLTGANLIRANLYEADLTKADLEAADLWWTTLSGVTVYETIAPDGTVVNSEAELKAHIDYL